MWDAENNNGNVLYRCPFCGGEPKEYEDNGMESTIECTDCGASMYRHESDGKDYVRRCRLAWNRRF